MSLKLYIMVSEKIYARYIWSPLFSPHKMHIKCAMFLVLLFNVSKKLR